MTSNEEKELLVTDKNLSRAKNFIVTKKIRDFSQEYFYIDEVNKLWCVPKISIWNNELKRDKTLFYSYSDIVSFELQVDGKVITSSTSGGLGSAVVGGLLFGGVGAIVGSNTGKKRTNSTVNSTYTVNITVNSIQNPNITINIANKKIANEIMSTLQLIYNSQLQNNTNSQENINNVSVTDEIKKFKELLDIGAITQEEFDIKKKQLLGISSNNEIKSISKENDNNEISSAKIKCKVCGKEIEYTENETCEECDKIIRERLRKKKENALATDSQNNSITQEIELENLIVEKNDNYIKETEIENSTDEKNYDVIQEKIKDNNTENIKKDINQTIIKTLKITWDVIRYCFGILLILFSDDLALILFGISILPLPYKILSKYTKISKKVRIIIAIVLPIIVLLVTALVETNNFRNLDIYLNVGENYTIPFSTEQENCQIISSDENIITIDNNTIYANQTGVATVEIKLNDEVVSTIKIDVKEKDDQDKVVEKQNNNNSSSSYLKKYKNLKEFGNEVAAQNFVNVLAQLNMDVSKVKHLSKLDDWANGDLFSFDYELQTYCIYFYENYEIKAITKGLNREDIYLNENANFIDEKATNSTIILQYGQLGEYGKYDKYDGENYIRYYIPEGTYEVKALVRNSMFYIEGQKIYKSALGGDESETIDTISLTNTNDKQTITIKANECISLTIGTSISLTKK